MKVNAIDRIYNWFSGRWEVILTDDLLFGARDDENMAAHVFSRRRIAITAEFFSTVTKSRILCHPLLNLLQKSGMIKKKCVRYNMDLNTLKQKMDQSNYIYDDTLATVLYVALALKRPLLIEGAAGVGKTEVAKVMASALDRDLVRLQCYEGLDESKALYEWNYQKQLLSIQVNMNQTDRDELTASLFRDEYLLERPLLQSIKSEKPVVLLIDEIDKADVEFEAFLLELLSDMQVSIPEIGTIKANSIPFVVLTSNRARPLSEALRRRCAYLYIEYPDMEKELAILRAKLPHVDDRLCAQVALAVQKLRSNESILKKPSIAETLDWAAALDALGIRELTPDAVRQTAGFILKNSEDIAAIDTISDSEEPHSCHHCGGHHHG